MTRKCSYCGGWIGTPPVGDSTWAACWCMKLADIRREQEARKRRDRSFYDPESSFNLWIQDGTDATYEEYLALDFPSRPPEGRTSE